jgi:hypothetical protein
MIAKIAISCDPKPVNFVFAENGVIKVQPDIVCDALEHITVKLFFSTI